MKLKSIAILFGGNSSEYEVSLQSAGAIIKNFPYDKYTLYMIGITKTGKWYHYQGEVENILNDTWSQETMNSVSISLGINYGTMIEITNNKVVYYHIDAVLPVLHGKNGEDGTIQGLMCLANIPIIGSGILASALCMDKYRAHELVKSQGIKVTKSFVISRNGLNEEIFDLKFPVFVKPLKAGSSYGISKVLEHKDLKYAISLAFKYDDEVVIEEEVIGFEVGCGVIGNKHLEVGVVDEIELTGEFFNFDEKYTLKSSKIHLPARVDQKTIKKIQDTAKKIYRILGCQIFARVDMFLTPQNEIYFNEVNTIPGFTSHSRFPQMMKAAGYEFSRLIDVIIEMGLNNESNLFR